MRRLTAVGLVLIAGASATGCAKFGHRDRVLWRVPSPDGTIVAVCQEVPVLDGPTYNVRLERPDGAIVRRLYEIGDGDPCSEVAWSADGTTLAVLTGHVARVRVVDVAWALRNPDVTTAAWSWRQVDLSTDRRRFEASTMRFSGPMRLALGLCDRRVSGASWACAAESRTHQFDIPLPIVTGH